MLLNVPKFNFFVVRKGVPYSSEKFNLDWCLLFYSFFSNCPNFASIWENGERMHYTPLFLKISGPKSVSRLEFPV
jgi:hypothetical protein